MAHLDRLSALLARFSLAVTPAPLGQSNLAVLECTRTSAPSRILFRAAQPLEAPEAGDRVAFSASLAWGGDANPLIRALPGVIAVSLADDPDTALIAQALKSEGATPRCGGGKVLECLCEILLVRVLRAQLEQGSTEPGLLGGLADPRLSRAIVAMHDAPGHAWRNEDLARLAGLSLSRFAQLFLVAVGETPMAYLRHWRMTLARQDIERGDRIQSVARRYGYASPEALNRAFHKIYELSPTGARKRGLE